MTDPETRKKRSQARKRNYIAKKMREDMPKKVHLSKKDREKQRVWRLKDDPTGDYENVDDFLLRGIDAE